MIRFTGVCAALIAALTMSTVGAAESGDWLVRTGPIAVFPDDDSESVLGGRVGVGDGTGLGLTIAHRVTDRVGIEVLLSSPISHGNPPILSAAQKWH